METGTVEIMSLFLDIRKKLPHFTLDVSFSCAPGTLTAIVGPSGAGKSTLMRILSGLDLPDDGRITFDGRIWNDTTKDIFLHPRKRRIGMVFQDYPLFPHFSVLANISFGGNSRDSAMKLLEKFNIAHLAQKKPGVISGGERQRVSFCQALAREPSLLFLDEPFSALDQETRFFCCQELLTLKAEMHIPIIHITHDLEEAVSLADQIFVMDQGKKSTRWLNRQQEQSALLRPGFVPFFNTAVTC